MRVSLIQVSSEDELEKNIKKVDKYLNMALESNPDVIVLPEMFMLYGNSVKDGIVDMSNIEYYKTFAKNNNVNLVLGSVALRGEKLPTNTCFVISRNGEIVSQYDKIHMYKVDREEFKIDEKNAYNPGEMLGLAEIDGVRVGIGICFDLRFPEYFRALMMQDIKAIFLPSAYRKLTGALTWEPLNKARAIENQCYMISCNQTGELTYGNSMVVSYDGSILGKLDEEEGILVQDIDFSAEEKFRKENPVLDYIK